MEKNQDFWVIHSRKFTSRLLHCFGGINDPIDRKTAINFIKNSGTEFLTIYTHGDLEKIKSIDDFPIGYSGLKYKDIRESISNKKYTILVNTNHALTVEEAIKRVEVGYRYSNSKWIKFEVLNHNLTRPINKDVIRAAGILLDKEFIVLPLINANIQDAQALEKIGCGAIRVLMNDIGSENGFINKELFTRVCSTVKIPVIAEGGCRGPEDAYYAMVAGASAVLVNKSLFSYKDPLFYLESLKHSIKSGRLTLLCNQQRKT
jgi:thiazole synthase ThiGH ThiG subunit